MAGFFSIVNQSCATLASYLDYLGFRDSSPVASWVDTAAVATTSLRNLEMLLWQFINRERFACLGKGYGLGWSKILHNVARSHSADMISRRYFSHYTPEGLDTGERLRRTGVKFYSAGENISTSTALLGVKAIEEAHIGLMKSEGHRQNILNPDFTHLGVGIATGHGRYTITEVFVGI